MVLVTVLYLSMGLLGYLTFGDGICGSVTLNLPEEALYASVKILYTCVIFVSFAIQFYVPITFLWPPLKEKYLMGSSGKINPTYKFSSSWIFSPKNIDMGIIISICVGHGGMCFGDCDSRFGWHNIAHWCNGVINVGFDLATNHRSTYFEQFISQIIYSQMHKKWR